MYQQAMKKLTVSFPPDPFSLLVSLAAQRNTSLSALVRSAFRAAYPQPEAEIGVRELSLAWFRRDRTRALDRFHRWERHFTRDIDKMLKLLSSLPQASESEADKT